MPGCALHTTSASRRFAQIRRRTQSLHGVASCIRSRLPKSLRRAHRHPSPVLRPPALRPTSHSKPRQKCAMSAPTQRGEHSWGPLCTVNRDASVQSRPEPRWAEGREGGRGDREEGQGGECGRKGAEVCRGGLNAEGPAQLGPTSHSKPRRKCAKSAPTRRGSTQPARRNQPDNAHPHTRDTHQGHTPRTHTTDTRR